MSVTASSTFEVESDVVNGNGHWQNPCRRFHLQRHEDLSGMSGTGVVAYGVVFPDGRVAMRWDSEVATSVIYDSIAHVHYLHSHEGRTDVVFDDN